MTDSTLIPTIQRLPETLISQITAGEVVERPASALKELLDNAIDAGATRIEAKVDGGGLQRIEITDNGKGISEVDLPMAFERHATSKIRTFDDLMNAMTLGFRGEALASLASVARVSITTRQGDERVGRQLVCENGSFSPMKPAAGEPGTTVRVDDLFFFVPARRKFMKSGATEFNHCRDAFLRAALSRPEIAFVLFRDQKKVLDFPVQSALERAQSVLGPQIAERLAPLNGDVAGMTLTGFAAPVRALPTGREFQWLFVNGRFTRDRLLAAAAREALAETQGLGREKDVAFVAFLTISPQEIDVNAHPAKTEVRFKDPRGARQFLKTTLAQVFSSLPQDDASSDPFGQDPLAQALSSEAPGRSAQEWLATQPQQGGHTLSAEGRPFSGHFGGSGGMGGVGRSGGFGGSSVDSGRSRSDGLAGAFQRSDRSTTGQQWDAPWRPRSTPRDSSLDALSDTSGRSSLWDAANAKGSGTHTPSAMNENGVSFETDAQDSEVARGTDSTRLPPGTLGFLPQSGHWLVDAPDGAVLIPTSILSVANLAAVLGHAACGGEVVSQPLLEPASAPLSASQAHAVAAWVPSLRRLGFEVEPLTEQPGWNALAFADGLPGLDWSQLCEALSELPPDLDDNANLARAALQCALATLGAPQSAPNEPLDSFWAMNARVASLLPGAVVLQVA